MRKRIAKYPIPNFKIQIQFLNRNGKQFAFAVKSPGRFLPFRKNKRSCPTLPVSFCRRKEYTADGFDDIEYEISTNPGESLKPLGKIVSGGELSRIMLAIKAILADRDQIETLIFDEIDTGISGRTAQKVSEKMAVIGRCHQVLCITHLPQIAAMADTHFEIEKHQKDNETITEIHPLEGDDSVRELARLLGGAEITQAVFDNAKEMKELAQVHKNTRLK